jgi:hypothetical protein
MRQSRKSCFFDRRWLSAMFAAAAVTAGTAQGQRSLPFSDDALVLNFGQVRTGVHGSFSFYDQVYADDGTVQNYGSPLSFASAGTTGFSQLIPVEAGIRNASGQNAFQLSLGSTDAGVTHRSGSTSLLLDVGLPARFMISVEVPFVRVETAINITANNGAATTANVGVNPAVASASVFAADTAVANQIFRARTALNSQLASCLGSTAQSCSTINARRTEAQALVAASSIVSGGILAIASSPFAPLAGSTAHSAITARIASIANSYRDFGISTITGTTVAPAATPITAAQYRDLVSSSVYGMGGTLPAYKVLTRLGDVNVAAKFRLAESDKVRAAAYGKIYFPTGGQAASGELFPLAAGEGTTRTEVGGIADILPYDRLSLTASASSILWLAKTVTVKSTLHPALESTALSTEPGLDFMALRNRRTGFNFSLTPRYEFNRWMMLGAQFQSRRLSREQFSDVGIDDLAVWNQQGATTENRIGAGFSFSNLTSSRSTGPRFPIEASFFHSQSISGKGLQPKIFSDEFRIRIFARR